MRHQRLKRSLFHISPNPSDTVLDPVWDSSLSLDTTLCFTDIYIFFVGKLKVFSLDVFSAEPEQEVTRQRVSVSHHYNELVYVIADEKNLILTF